jgi:hypothetical protein
VNADDRQLLDIYQAELMINESKLQAIDELKDELARMKV